MRKFIPLLLLVITNSAYSQNPTGYIADWKGDARGAYSIIHDDYGATVVDGIWQYADTICANRDIKFTFGAIASDCESTRDINGYAGPYDYAQQVMMAQHNHEIMSHSHTHNCAVGNAGWSPCDQPAGGGWGEMVGSAGFTMELETAHNSIQTNTGFAPVYYIYPYDRFTDAANNRLKEMGYLGSRTGWTSPRFGDAAYHRNGYNNNDENDFYPDNDGFFRTSVQVFDDGDAALSDAGQAAVLNNEVDNAINNNMWANRELHNVGSNGWGAVELDAYRAHIDYIQTRVNAGDLWVATVSEIMTYQMQKLKVDPNFGQIVGDSTFSITWDAINPQYNFSLATYLAPLTIKCPVTLVVDLKGRPGLWAVRQNGNEIFSYTQDGDMMKIEVFPHEGDLQVYSTISPPNQPPFIENPTDAFVNLNVGFNPFSIDLNDIFEDSETADASLIYTVSGNSNVQVNIINGIANISAAIDWEGSEVLTFAAEDLDGLSVSTTVNITATDLLDGHTPFGGTPITIPGRVEAENYDEGAAEVVFHEISTSWEPGPWENPYRSNSPVDVTNKAGGGYSVDYTETGEWMHYTINVESSGLYDVVYNIAQELDQWGTPIGQITLYIDNVEWIGATTMVYTSDWDNFEQVTNQAGAYLSAGTHLLRIEFASGSTNLDYIDFVQTVAASNDLATDQTFEIYPNPVIEELGVDGVFDSFQVIDQRGDILKESSDDKINVSDLPAGIYFVKTNRSGERKSFVKAK